MSVALLESPILAASLCSFSARRKRNASVWASARRRRISSAHRTSPTSTARASSRTRQRRSSEAAWRYDALREHVHLNETALNQIKTFAHPRKGHSAEFLIAIGEKAESTHAIRIVPSRWTTGSRQPTPRAHVRMWWMWKHASMRESQLMSARRAFSAGVGGTCAAQRRAFRRSSGVLAQ